MAPASPPPPDRFEAPIDLWNPGGDPAVLRRAARAWRQMAATLRDVAHDLGSAVRQLGQGWDGSAHRDFAQGWEQLEATAGKGADTFERVANTLEDVAGQIEETNEQVHQLYAAIGVTIAFGVVSSALTLGFASPGAAAAAAAQAGQATTIVARLGTFLTISARSMGGFRVALAAFSKRWAIAAAGNLAAGAAQRAVFNKNHNPLDNWSIADVTRIVVSATSSAGFGTVASNSPRWAALASGHPKAAVFSGGFLANGTGSVANDLWVDGRPLSVAVPNGLVNGVSGGASTAATRSIVHRLPNASPPAVPPPALPRLLVVRRPALWLPRSAVGREALVSVPMDGAVQGLATTPFLPEPEPPRAPAPFPTVAPVTSP